MPIKVGDSVNGKHAALSGTPKWREQARVMAIAEGYAMVQFKGCAPFIESLKDLERWNKPTENAS